MLKNTYTVEVQFFSVDQKEEPYGEIEIEVIADTEEEAENTARKQADEHMYADPRIDYVIHIESVAVIESA